jgi:hypothetical protein
MPVLIIDISQEDHGGFEVEFGTPRYDGFGSNVQIVGNDLTLEMSYEQAEEIYQKFKPFFEIEPEEEPHAQQPTKTRSKQGNHNTD